MAFRDFDIVILEWVTIDSSLPAGGIYNVPLPLTIRGSNLFSFGGARCRFVYSSTSSSSTSALAGPFVGDAATVVSNRLVYCPKPAFPDEVRDIQGTYTLEYYTALAKSIQDAGRSHSHRPCSAAYCG